MAADREHGTRPVEGEPGIEARIDRAMRRPWQYWYQDGLAEMAMGAIFAALGLAFLVQAWLPPGPFLTLVSMFGPVVAVIGVGLLARRIVSAVKLRLTYPRTGFVAYRKQRRNRLAARFALGLALGALVGSLAALPSLLVWIPAIIGLIIGGIHFCVAYRLDLPRFYLLAAASAALGTLVSLGRLGDLPGGAAYFVGIGLADVLSGALTLAAYLRSTRPPAEDADHGE